MTGNSTTVNFDHNLRETAEGVSKSKISGDSVDNYETQSIHAITQSDISLVPVFLNDLSEKGLSLSLIVEGRSGSIKKITDNIRKYGGRTATIVTSLEGTPKGHRRVDILIYGIDRRKFPQLRQELRGKAKLLLYFQEQPLAQFHREASA
jgi:hypothetical protein